MCWDQGLGNTDNFRQVKNLHGKKTTKQYSHKTLQGL